MMHTLGMTDQRDYDAVIIGAGVIGSAIAYELSRRGHRTLSVDKGPSAGYGPTSASCAIVRFSYSTYQGVAMSYEGLRYWENWADYLESDPEHPVDETGLISFTPCGTVLIKTSGAGHHDKVLPLLAQLGIPHQDWTTEELIDRMPAFSAGEYGPPKRPDDAQFWAEPPRQIAGGVYTPESGYVSDPAQSAHNLMRAAEAKGARFRFRTEVTAVNDEIVERRRRTTGVTLADGSVVLSPVVVNVAGPHSYLVNQMAGVYDSMNIKTRALRHEVHHVPMGGVDYDNGWHVQDGDLGIYFRPEVGRNILIGSEDPECDPQDWVDPDDYDTEISDEQWDAQVLRTARRLPELGIPTQKKGVVSAYDVSDDWIPIYDRTDLDGFYVAIGTSGNQFKNAGVAGHCMAELIEAVQAGHDHDADPLKVTGRFTGLELDLGAYSRNRQINMNSSFSVNG
jgi:sarcosine oxidase subunit beta